MTIVQATQKLLLDAHHKIKGQCMPLRLNGLFGKGVPAVTATNAVSAENL